MRKQGLGLNYIANAMPFVHETDFWGPVSNFGIPIAAVMDTQKDPEMYALSLSLSLPSIFILHAYPYPVYANENQKEYGT